MRETPIMCKAELRSLVRYGMTAVALVLATACSTATANKIKSEHRNPEWEARKLDKVLVVGVYERSHRIAAESVFVEQLKEHGIDAVTSYEAFADIEKMIDADSVRQKLEELDVDAVISIATLKSRPQYEHSNWWGTYGLMRLLGASQQQAGGFATLGDTSDYYSQGELHLEVSLYDAISLDPIWIGETDSYMFNQGSADEVQQLADFLVGVLTQRGIL